MSAFREWIFGFWCLWKGHRFGRAKAVILDGKDIGKATKACRCGLVREVKRRKPKGGMK